MQQKELLYGAIGLIIGIVITSLITTNIVNSNNTSMMKMMGMNTAIIQKTSSNEKNNEHMMSDGSMMSNMHGMTMEDMVEDLERKTGDDFDKLFISEMIEHHQGAIDMANLAKKSAKHDEIRSMADDIISAQTNEIDMMKKWQKEWGYDN
ncbi:MAG: DUF305 domain-containing protein [Candidatus Levybacteria bacterium]|nr:DUF305 domain-containing protein [Candidatus Levybacteria bacterium]